MQDTQETWDRSLGRGDRLQKEMATQSQYSCQENPWTGEPVFLAAVGTSPSPYLSSCPPIETTSSKYLSSAFFVISTPGQETCVYNNFFLLYPLQENSIKV